MSSHPSLPVAGRAEAAVKNAGRRGTGIVFAVMITVLLVAIVFAANENQVIGWIVAIIAGGWLLLAAVVVATFRRGARKLGNAVDSARADAAARNSAQSSSTVVVDEDTHARNLKLDHSFKIVQVQKRVIAEELEQGEQADHEMIQRALDTIETTAHNGRDMLAVHTGRGESSDQRGPTGREDGDSDTIEGDIVN